MKVHRYTVRMNDTDAAGRIYFADQFRIAHESFEVYLAEEGQHFGRFLREYPYMIPIVHAKADYRVPLFVGDHLRIELTVGRIGYTSFTMNYRLFREPDEVLVGTVSVVHATIAKEGGRPIPLPDPIRHLLRRLGEPEGRIGSIAY